VLFVSVDPARDNLMTLCQYTEAFGSAFIGLRGDQATLDQLTRRYRVTYGHGEKDTTGNYEVSHSSAVFAFDQEGQPRLLMRESDPKEALITDLRQLLAGG
jgi:protein SCO1/2